MPKGLGSNLVPGSRGQTGAVLGRDLFVVTVPEVGTAALMRLDLAGLTAARRRRR